jgi:hypothetical protein
VNEGQSTFGMVAGLQILPSRFLAYFNVKFWTQNNMEPQPIEDGAGSLKLSVCQSPHLAKISEIKSISKPLMILGRNLHPLTEYADH